jgi:hypothetical protein
MKRQGCSLHESCRGDSGRAGPPGVVETLADLGFDPAPLAEAVIKAADGDVIRFPGSPRGH